jgi:hypothetical protein
MMAHLPSDFCTGMHSCKDITNEEVPMIHAIVVISYSNAQLTIAELNHRKNRLWSFSIRIEIDQVLMASI